MKIAIVSDTVPNVNYFWHIIWAKMCIENNIEYQMYDSFKPDFIDELIKDKPDKTLWRSGNSPHMKFKDETQRQILDKLNLRVIPNWNTHWVYDHKIRQTYLFKKHKIPVPETHIFFKEKTAMNWTKRTMYPFVIKADGGAGSKSLRFVGNRGEAVDIIRNTFQKKGKWTGREYESHVIYAQEYIPIEYAWRVGIIKNKVAFGYKLMVKPGTYKASSQGMAVMMPISKKLLDFGLRTNKKLGFDWGLFDIIYSNKHKKYMVLEVCDTCGLTHLSRKLTYYRENNKWVSRKESFPIERLVFNEFILNEMKK